jgi:hypothetical protein
MSENDAGDVRRTQEREHAANPEARGTKDERLGAIHAAHSSRQMNSWEIAKIDLKSEHHIVQEIRVERGEAPASPADEASHGGDVLAVAPQRVDQSDLELTTRPKYAAGLPAIIQSAFCGNGAKAASEENTRQCIERDFFRGHSVEQLSQHSDYWLARQGRIAGPMVLRSGATHYEPILWDDAFALIGQKLNALATPDEAAFYTSGRTANETAFLIAELGLTARQVVDVTSHFEGETRTARQFLVVPYDTSRRCAASYFPEANVLVPVNSVAERSNTPTSKYVVVTLAPSAHSRPFD